MPMLCDPVSHHKPYQGVAGDHLTGHLHVTSRSPRKSLSNYDSLEGQNSYELGRQELDRMLLLGFPNFRCAT